MLDFLKRRFAREAASRSEHAARYRWLVNKIVSTGDLVDPDATLMEKTMAALGISPDDLVSDVAGAKRLAALQRTAGEAEARRIAHKQASVKFAESEKNLPVLILKLKAQHNEARNAWQSAGAAFTAASDAVRQLEEMKRTNPLLFDLPQERPDLLPV